MKKIKTIIILSSILISSHAQSALYWVGDAPECTQSNHVENLFLALLFAITNGTEDDEIRLTNSVEYFGETRGDYVLTNWNSGDNGTLIIAGGYNTCNGTQNGRTVIGNSSDTIFEISDNSHVTLRNIEITLGEKRGLVVSEDSNVRLENVDIAFNNGGISVSGGSFLQADGNTIVQFNERLSTGTPFGARGGGISCNGNGSEVSFSGRLIGNKSGAGGNIHVSNDCFFVLEQGALVQGAGTSSDPDASSGGAVSVDFGGKFFANGGQQRVLITDHFANTGGAIYVLGSTSQVTLFNTFINNNHAVTGSGIYAAQGGNSNIQVLMDRVGDCPFLISCSEFDRNSHSNSLVYIDDSQVRISRTLFDRNVFSTDESAVNGMIEVKSGGKLELSYSNFISNEAFHLIENYGAVELTHVTAVDNGYNEPAIGNGSSFAWFNAGIMLVENSIWQQTQGAIDNGTAVGKCNLVDDATDWPNGSFVVGAAIFNNVAGGDARQQANSPGVDMCQPDTFSWNLNRDIEYQAAPVNENTNPQGMPGENGGLYDAGFDEVYDNIGPDKFLLTVQKQGSGEGIVLSAPAGIACGSDCSEVYFNGTMVTLTATASADNLFVGWHDCPFADGSGNCEVVITESMTIFAEFETDDLIYANGFE